jgi:hypothetical protein
MLRQQCQITKLCPAYQHISKPLIAKASGVFTLVTGNAYDRLGDTRTGQMVYGLQAINVMEVN